MTMYDIFSHEGSGMGVTVVDDDIRSCGQQWSLYICVSNALPVYEQDLHKSLVDLAPYSVSSLFLIREHQITRKDYGSSLVYR
jgi:hypothetical protein